MKEFEAVHEDMADKLRTLSALVASSIVSWGRCVRCSSRLKPTSDVSLKVFSVLSDHCRVPSKLERGVKDNSIP